MIDKIVSFCENADQSAAVWCRKNEIHGKVIEEEHGILKIDVGLYYMIYAKPDQVQVVPYHDILILSSEMQTSAPIPE